MNKPTDQQLNEAMAAACGWQLLESDDRKETGNRWYIVAPDGTKTGNVSLKREDAEWHFMSIRPDYCTDRNSLPAILDAVEAAGKQWAMATRLDKDISKGVVESAWIMWRLPMREVVIAALKALQKWPAEWDTPE